MGCRAQGSQQGSDFGFMQVKAACDPPAATAAAAPREAGGLAASNGVQAVAAEEKWAARASVSRGVDRGAVAAAAADGDSVGEAIG